MPRSAEKEAAYVLDETQVFADVPVHFANFPGVWQPGQPIAASALIDQLTDVDTEDELAERITADALPLTATDVKVDSAPLPWDPMRIPSEEEVRTGRAEAPDKPMPQGELLPTGTLTAEVAAMGGEPEGPASPAEMTVEQLDAAYGDLDGYPKSANKDEKVAFAELQEEPATREEAVGEPTPGEEPA